MDVGQKPVSKDLCLDLLGNVNSRLEKSQLIWLNKQLEKLNLDGVMENATVALSAKAVVTSTGKLLSSEELRAYGLGDSPRTARVNAARKARLPQAIPELDITISYGRYMEMAFQ